MRSSLGLPQNVAQFLAYFLGWVSGLIVLIIEKGNPEVKYHAAQSLVAFAILSLSGIVGGALPAIGPPISALVGVVSLAFWGLMLITSLLGRPPRLRFLQPLVERVLGLPA